MASQRCQKNHISSIFDAQDTWFTSEDDISTIAEDYFQQLFLATVINNMEPVLEFVDKFVTLAMNSTLLQDYITEKVKCAFFQIHPSIHRALIVCPFFSSRSIGTLWVKLSPKQCSQHYVLVIFYGRWAILISYQSRRYMNQSISLTFVQSVRVIWCQESTLRSWPIELRLFCLMLFLMPIVLLYHID